MLYIRLIQIAFVITLLTCAGTAAQAAGVININTANATQLDALPGIGATKAQAIIDYRTAHGPFTKPADIQNVKGIGPATYAKLENQITVGAQPVQVNSVQPTPLPPSYTKVQKVESPSVKEVQTHDDAALAPAAAPSVAAAGAALTSPAPRGDEMPTHSPFNSVWTYGLVGVILIAGGAFILL